MIKGILGKIKRKHGKCEETAKIKRYGDRPSWDYTFLSIAHQIALRSHDSETKCGAVIVDKHHRIVGVGFNGFVRNINDDILPSTRPSKYPFMLHAELNAILNCQHSPEMCTIYVTGKPCIHCIQCIYQSGITTVIYDKNHKIHMSMDKQSQENFSLITSLMNLQIVAFDYRS